MYCCRYTLQHNMKRAKQTASDEQNTCDNSAEECPVCFEPFSSDGNSTDNKRCRRNNQNEVSLFKKREVFPCEHKHVFCVECSSKLDVCPLCRQGRDGTSQDQRIEREELERNSIASIIAISRSSPSEGLSMRGFSGTIIIPIPTNLEHPFDTNNVRVSVFSTSSSTPLITRNDVERAIATAMQSSHQ